ncbi:MAG TPA: hypothetical protein VH251_01140, partial [Verrucomicrobiae bacterium]|nr:hypothetical protein [Verrucomicrobiae bacterium]
MNDNLKIATHEAGHSVVASHFKIPALPEILDEGRSIATQTTYPDYAGLCSYDDGRIPLFQYAAICWGGQLAQCLYGTPPNWAPQYKPTALLLRDWWAAMMVQIKRFSDGDRAGIMASYKNSWRACKSSHRIVTKNRTRITRLAKAMTAGRDAKPPVPMPENFPATLADFLRLVVADGTTEPAARLRAFVSDQTEKFFAEKQFVFDDPAARLQAMSSWTTARLAKYEADFTNADDWQGAARAWRAWT